MLNYAVDVFDPMTVASAIEACAGVVWAPTADDRREVRACGEFGVHQDVDLGDNPEYRAADGITAPDDDS